MLYTLITFSRFESILSSFSLVVLSKWGPPVINKISLECRHSEILLIRIGSNFKCIQPLFSVEVSNKKVVSYKVIDHLIRTDTEPLLSHTQSYCSMCLPLFSNITPSKRGPHEVTGIYILLRADHASAHLGGPHTWAPPKDGEVGIKRYRWVQPLCKNLRLSNDPHPRPTSKQFYIKKKLYISDI